MNIPPNTPQQARADVIGEGESLALEAFENEGGSLGPETETAESLVSWIDEGGNIRAGGNLGMSRAAYNFQSGTSGARSSVLTGRSQASYLEFIDEEGNVIGAKFDGVEGMELIDRKLNPSFYSKVVDQANRQVAVAQYYGLQAIWELPTQSAVNAANRFMQINNITGITVRLAL